jgi:Protein of unknown function (DUF2842)
MTIRTRKLIGAFGLLLLVTVWSLLAMALAQSVLTDINGLVAAIYYKRPGGGGLLYRRRARLGTARHVVGEMDGASG